MHRNLSKFATIALVAASGFGVPALAKSTYSKKVKVIASLTTRDVKAHRQRALDARAQCLRIGAALTDLRCTKSESSGIRRRRQHGLQRQPLRFVKLLV
jgi:hypothetical protein